MRRCANCEFENGADATACARCGQPLSRDGGVATAARGEMPAWLSSLQSGEGGEKASATPAGGAVAAAAALPIQVRRSRVPVLSVDAPRLSAPPERPGAGNAADTGVASKSGQAGAAVGAGALAVAPTASRNRQRVLLLLLLIIAIIMVVVLRHALP